MNSRIRKSLTHAALIATALTLMTCLSMVAHSQDAQTFATADEAAVAGLTAAEALSPDFEAGGTIYLCGTRYAVMPPVTSHKRTSVDVTIYASAECKLIALYHTHPKGDARYSVPDIKAACSLHAVSYIKPRNGNVRAFNCMQLSEAAVRIATDGSRPITGDSI